jgi:hypothetical protein
LAGGESTTKLEHNYRNFNRETFALLSSIFLLRINEDENLEAVSPKRCQGRGCSRGLNLDGEKG